MRRGCAFALARCCQGCTDLQLGLCSHVAPSACACRISAIICMPTEHQLSPGKSAFASLWPHLPHGRSTA
eukprot:12672166-Alexandrium_andersonii.AAC.1